MWVDNIILWLALWIYKRGEIKFRVWLRLEGLKEKVIKAVEEGGDFPTHVVDFVATALHVPAKYIQDAWWSVMIQAFYEIVLKLPNVKLPITEPTYENIRSEDWDYDGRTWHRYAHMLAKEYGWTLEYISRLRVEEALAKIQEILVDEQLEREFQHSLSEIAYPYNSSTKKSEFRPLTRPAWMRPKVKIEKIKKRKIPATSLPIGTVNYDSLPEEFRPQTIIH